MAYLSFKDCAHLFAFGNGSFLPALLNTCAHTSICTAAYTATPWNNLLLLLPLMVVTKSCDMADIDFQGKHADEEFHLYFHQHWIRLIWPLTKLIVWNALIFTIGYLMLELVTIEEDITRRLILSFLTIFFLLAHFEFLARFYRYFLYVIVVTDKKIHRIKKSLLTLDDHQSMDLWMLQDINKCQHGIIQNILGFGSIILEAQETIIRIHFTPNISDNYERLMHLRERARARMGYIGGMLHRE